MSVKPEDARLKKENRAKKASPPAATDKVQKRYGKFRATLYDQMVRATMDEMWNLLVSRALGFNLGERLGPRCYVWLISVTQSGFRFCSED
jgi:hypothetical protein